MRACTCRKVRPGRSGRMFVLMQDAAEPVATADVERGEPVRIGDRFGQRLEWYGVRDALVRPVRVGERLVVAEGMQEVALVVDQGAVEEFSAASLHPVDAENVIRPAQRGRSRGCRSWPSRRLALACGHQ